jgi:hypothetical protein
MTYLPAHVLLTSLPFSAYVTTNYDVLLETALEKVKRRPLAIIQDSDVSRLRPHHTPVLKLHGCVTRPPTMIAAADEYVPWSERSPIIEALLKALHTNRRI